jgi:hypothetical protein
LTNLLRFRRGLIPMALLIALATPAAAESLLEISPPGEPMLPLDAHSLALGGAAESRWSLESGLPANPAQLVAMDGITFATVIQLRRGFRELDEGDWDETRQDFPAFQVSAALPGHFRLGVGYRADLRSRGSFSYSVPFDLGLSGDSYQVRYEQDGGLSRFPISLARRIGDNHRLGVGLNLYRGNQNQEYVFDFPNLSSGDPDLGYQDRKVRRKARWAGTGFVLGLQSRPLGSLATLSARWESGADLEGESQEETAGEDDLELEALAGEIPGRWALGIAFQLPRGGLASLQWEHENWGDYDSPLPAESLRDVDRFGLGFEWLWGQSGRRGEQHRQFPVRLGLRRANWPAPDPLTGGEIIETTWSLGSGFDVQDGRGSVDFTLFWQQLDVEGAQGERRLGLALSLRTSEHWRKRTQPF